MRPDPDDDALRWEGDDDPTLAPGWKVVGKPAPPDAATDGTDAAASDADTVAEEPAPGPPAADSTRPEPSHDTDASRQAGSAELVILGVLGGVYLLYAIGWLFWAITPPPELADPVAQFMYGLGRWLAVAAPGAVVRHRAVARRRAPPGEAPLAHRGGRAPRAHSVPAARLR